MHNITNTNVSTKPESKFFDILKMFIPVPKVGLDNFFHLSHFMYLR
jgi:hypothetical protein